MHYYQFNIGDYRKDTGHLTLLEHGIYRNLLDSYYLNEGGLCADDAKLMRTHSIRNADEQEAYKSVIADFFNEQDGYYIHDKCEDVMGKIFAKSEKARVSAQKRWEKNANGMRTHSEGNAKAMLPNTQYPLPNNPKPIKRGAFSKPSPEEVDNYSKEKNINLDGFHDFYTSNGWKVGRNAMKDWQATARNWAKRDYSSNSANSNKPSNSIFEVYK